MPLKLKNFSIRQFNQDVNRSHNPDEKYQRWAMYRRQITSLFAGIWHRSIVLGAGELNDIDLMSMCRASDEVVLADIDTDAVLQGIERQRLPIGLKQKISVVQHDFSGAQNARLFEKLEAAVQQQMPANSIISILEEALAVIRPEPLLPGQSFDLILSCPVYTQLVYTQIEVLLKILYASGLYAYDDLNRILVTAHRGMQAVLGHYNDLLLSLSAPGSHLIMLTDVLELQADDPQLPVLTSQFDSKTIDIAFIQSLLDTQGLDLALSGLDDLAGRLESHEICHFLWPFDPKKSYVVRGLIGHDIRNQT